jgi:hypothetical protein
MPDKKTLNDKDKWRLPFGFLAGPVLWGLQILVGYGLVTVSCTTGNKLPVYLTIALSGLIVLGLFFLLILATVITAFFLSPCPVITMPLP